MGGGVVPGVRLGHLRPHARGCGLGGNGLHVVLDYDVDDQAGIFSGLLPSESFEEAVSSSAPAGDRGPGPLAALAVVLLAGLGWYWARRGAAALEPSTRMYLRLRTATARAGLAVPPGLTPLALVDRIRTERSGAGGPAGRVVDLYLRARYGGESLGESDMREMKEALDAARRRLEAGR